MKILRINFKNIHSLKGLHTIDFEKPPLSDTGIFAIIGPTGAGKSTILDIIIIALYGQMPRLNSKISKSTVQKLGSAITRGTNEAFAEVEYYSNKNIYRSRWAIAKNRNGNWNEDRMELAFANTGKIISSSKRDVPALNEKFIGLNYNQFLKSIVLAQGDFAKFLKSDPNERALMLEKITGTEIYRIIGQKTFELAKNYSEKLENSAKNIENYSVLSDEQKQNINNSFYDIGNDIKITKNTISILENSLSIKKQIIELQNKLQKELDKLNINKENILKFKPYETKISVHQKLLPLKTEIFDIENIQNRTAENKKQIENNIQIISHLTNEINILSEKNKKIKINIENAINKQKNSIPIIRKTKELDKQKNSLSLIISNLQKEISENNKKISEYKNQIDNLLEINKKLQIQKNQINSWLHNNYIAKDLTAELLLIKQAINEYEEQKNISQKTINQSIFANNFANKEWKNYLDIIKQLKSDINNKFDNLNQEIQKYKSKNPKNELEKTLNQIQLIEKLKENAIKIKNIDNKITENNKLISENKLNLNQTISELKKTENELEIVQKTIEELEIRYKREQLEAKYEQDRLFLVENQACPLCGALHHPFANKKSKINIPDTQKQINNYNNLQKNLQKKILNLNSKLSALQTQLDNINKAISELKNEKIEYINNSNKILTKSASNLDYQKINEIEKYLKKLSEQKIILEKQIQTIDDIQKVNIKKQIIENLFEKINSTIEKRKNYTSLLTKYLKFIKGIKSNSEIISKLSSLANDFVRNNDILLNTENEIDKNSKLINQLNIQLKNHQQQQQQIQSSLENKKKEFDYIKNKIIDIQNNYFEGKNYEQFDKYLQEYISENKDNKAKIDNKISELNAKLSENKKNTKKLQEIIETETEKLKSKTKNLQLKLQKIGINNISEATEAILDNEEFERLNTKLQNLKEQNAIIKENISNLKKELQTLKEKDKLTDSIQDIENKINKNKQKLEELNKEIGRLTQILKNNEEKEQQLAKIQQEHLQLKAEAERWQKLNKLIGDKTGNKFAKIAQEFTMTHLISLANNHLKKFTDRYILDQQTDKDSNLFIYDKKFGMSRRSVKTLSGGETFLVSLALALALSDLASKNTQIESLFIDEGFGSLDKDTLNRALLNLELLHNNSNRKIGIISHVQDIKEHIETKIILQKDSSGISTIKIEP